MCTQMTSEEPRVSTIPGRAASTTTQGEVAGKHTKPPARCLESRSWLSGTRCRTEPWSELSGGRCRTEPWSWFSEGRCRKQPFAISAFADPPFWSQGRRVTGDTESSKMEISQYYWTKPEQRYSCFSSTSWSRRQLNQQTTYSHNKVHSQNVHFRKPGT